jgi:hypothetical protein
LDTLQPAARPASVRCQGIDPLRRLIITALRCHGVVGSFGARRLTGPQLFAALFGGDLANPALMWQVIFTCERLVDAAQLTCEPNAGRPDTPGSGGPDTFVWWPSQFARSQAQRQAERQRQEMLRGKIREHWVTPRKRALPRGYRASDQAQEAYARYVRELRGSNADAALPGGYTFVKGHIRGSDPGPIWLRLA